MMSKEQVIGVINVYTSRVHFFKAEEIKIKYASAKASLSSSKLAIEIPSDNINSNNNNKISEHELSTYVEARMEEIFQLAQNEINRESLEV